MAMIDLSFLYEMIHLEQTLPEAQRSQDIESVNLTIFLLYVPRAAEVVAALQPGCKAAERE